MVNLTRPATRQKNIPVGTKPQAMSTRSICAISICLCIIFAGMAGASVGMEPSDDVSGPAGINGIPHESDTINWSSAESPAANTSEVAIVRFTEGGSGNTNAPVTTSALKSEANDAQRAFVRYAESNPHVQIRNRLWLANAIVVEFDPTAVSHRDIRAVDGVKNVHENFEIETNTTTGHSASKDPKGADSVQPATNPTAGLTEIRAPTAWQRFDSRGGGIGVAVIDTGVDPDHEDINLSGWAEFDQYGIERLGTEPSDEDGHGTHVAGTVSGGNASGTAIGVAPNAELYGVKVADEKGEGTFAQVIAGMEWATEHDEVDVLQISLGANETADPFIEPVQKARDAGQIVVAAGGNTGQGYSTSPGNVYDAVAVGAVDESSRVAPFSSGKTITTESAWREPPQSWPDEYVVPSVSAPGVGVLSAKAGTETETSVKSGTSMAAPHVAGTAALVLSATNRSVNDDALRGILRHTATSPDGTSVPNDRYGYGIVNASAAVEAGINGPTPAEFSIVETAVPNTLETNQTIDIEAVVMNDGQQTGIENVSFKLISDRDSSENATLTHVEPTVRLEGAEKTTIRFTINSGDVPIGRYQYRIATENDSSTGTIDIGTGEQTDLTIESATVTPKTAHTGSTYNTTARYATVGPETTQFISVDFGTTDSNISTATDTSNVAVVGPNGQERGIEAVSIIDDRTVLIELNHSIVRPPPGDSIHVRIEHVLNPVEGSYNRTVSLHEAGADVASVAAEAFASDTVAYTIGPAREPSFNVSDLRPGDVTVARGTGMNVSATVSNDGTANGTANLTIGIDPESSNETTTAIKTNVSVPFGTNKTVTGQLQTDGLEPGQYTYGVFAEEKNATATLNVTDNLSGSITIRNQTQRYTDGSASLVVESATATSDFRIVVRDESGRVVGTTERYAAGQSVVNNTIQLDSAVTRRQFLTATIVFEVDGMDNKAESNEELQSTAFVSFRGPIVVGDAPATDVDGDGLFGDTTGDGQVDIFDVQLFFERLNREPIQTNRHLFDFTEDGSVDIFDVQRLFDRRQRTR